MSRKGNCFNNELKTEQIYSNKLISKDQMILDIFEYIKLWYNRKEDIPL
jgi:transposase InsO family protein